MSKNYEVFEDDKIILRDYLAKDRTVLANERTYLAYLRTFISLFAAGVGLLKYIDGDIMVKLLGWTFIVSSFILLILGTKRFFKVRKPLKKINPQKA